MELRPVFGVLVLLAFNVCAFLQLRKISDAYLRSLKQRKVCVVWVKEGPLTSLRKAASPFLVGGAVVLSSFLSVNARGTTRTVGGSNSNRKIQSKDVASRGRLSSRFTSAKSAQVTLVVEHDPLLEMKKEQVKQISRIGMALAALCMLSGIGLPKHPDVVGNSGVPSENGVGTNTVSQRSRPMPMGMTKRSRVAPPPRVLISTSDMGAAPTKRKGRPRKTSKAPLPPRKQDQAEGESVPAKGEVMSSLSQKPGGERPANISTALRGDWDWAERTYRAMSARVLIKCLPAGSFEDWVSAEVEEALDGHYDPGVPNWSGLTEALWRSDLETQPAAQAFADVTRGLIACLVDRAVELADNAEDGAVLTVLDRMIDLIDLSHQRFHRLFPIAVDIVCLPYGGGAPPGKLEDLYYQYAKALLHTDVHGLLLGTGEGPEESRAGTTGPGQLSAEERQDRLASLQFLFNIKEGRRAGIEQRILRESVMDMASATGQGQGQGAGGAGGADLGSLSQMLDGMLDPGALGGEPPEMARSGEAGAAGGDHDQAGGAGAAGRPGA